MHGHFTHDELVLHHYGEGTDADRARLGDHLAACPSCRQAWTETRDVLARFDSHGVPDPPADFEERMWQRLQPHLRSSRRAWSRRHVIPLAAAAAMVLVAASPIWLSREEFGQSHSPRVSPLTSVVHQRDQVLLAALDEHFAQTQMVLVEVMNAPADAPSLSFERSLAGDLVASGRLYRTTAAESGRLAIVDILDELEPLFVEIARSEQTGPANLDTLRARIDEGDLLFKVRAAGNHIRADESTTTLEKGTL